MNNNVLLVIVAAIVIIGGGALLYRGSANVSPEDEAALSSGAVNLGEESNMPAGEHMMEDGVMVEGEATGTVTTPEVNLPAGAVKEFTVTGKSFSFSRRQLLSKRAIA